MRTLITILMFATVAVAPAVADDLTLDQVLAKHFEAIGGVEAWKAVPSARISGKMVMGGGQMEAPFTIQFKRPGKARMEFTLQGMTGVQATDGESYWMNMPFMGQTGPEAMPADQAQQFKRQAEFESELIDCKDKGSVVELVGKTEVEGTSMYELKLTREDGDVTHLFLDAEYFVPIRLEGKADVQGNEMEFETVIGDYKEVGGLMFAHSMESRPKGSPVAVQTILIENVELGPELPDDLFSMPVAEPAAKVETKE